MYLCMRPRSDSYYLTRGEALIVSKGWTLLAEKLLNDPLTRNGRTAWKFNANVVSSC